MTHQSTFAYIAGIENDSLVDGPGLRTVVFFSGCQFACPQCHNVKYWNKEAGTKISIDDLSAKIQQQSKTRKITLSGGEPLEQIEAVYALIERLSDFEIGLYTGFELDEVPQDLISELHFIKTGQFKREEKVSNQYFGSANQQLIYLK